MCGLVGVMSKSVHTGLTKDELGVFYNLLYCSALRGADSTGVMTWDGRVIRKIKAALHPADFIYTKMFGQFVESHKDGFKAIFGHTRLATSGKIVAANAHPFSVADRIFMMHNGSVSKVPGVEDVKKYDVDSMALAEALNAKSADEVFEGFQGAVATIWFDKQLKTLNMYHNSQRPLAVIDTHWISYFASEGKMLDFVVNRPMKHVGHPTEVPTNTLWTWTLENLSTPRVARYIDYRVPVTVYEDSNYSHFPHRSNTNGWRRGGRAGWDYNSPQDIVVSDKAKEQGSWISVPHYGPFHKNKDALCIVYKGEPYKISDGGQIEKWKCLGLPVFPPSMSRFDNKEYNRIELVLVNLSKDDAERWVNEEYIIAGIANIRYNLTAKGDEERVRIFLGNPRPAKDYIDDNGEIITVAPKSTTAKLLTLVKEPSNGR